jgi:hypothetical protein
VLHATQFKENKVEVQYTSHRYGKESVETESISSFLNDQILYKEDYHCSREKVRLEAQPELVCAALGRLVDILLDKGILNLEDLHRIADTGWSMKDLKLKPEEKNES